MGALRNGRDIAQSEREPRGVRDRVTSPLGRALVIATLSEADSADVRSAREAFWRTRFHAAANLAREALNDRSATDTEVGTFIERLIGPLFLRVFITGAPVDNAFIRATVGAALKPLRKARVQHRSSAR